MNRTAVGWAPAYVGQVGQVPYYYPLTGPTPAPGGPSPGIGPAPGGGVVPVPAQPDLLPTAVAVAAFGLLGALLGWAVKPSYALAGAALGAGTRLATGPLVNPHVALPEPLQEL